MCAGGNRTADCVLMKENAHGYGDFLATAVHLHSIFPGEGAPNL